MARTSQALKKKVSCRICGKALDPTKPLTREPPAADLSDLPDGFYCVDCWLRSLRPLTADALLAKALERVLLE